MLGRRPLIRSSVYATPRTARSATSSNTQPTSTQSRRLTLLQAIVFGWLVLLSGTTSLACLNGTLVVPSEAMSVDVTKDSNIFSVQIRRNSRYLLG